MKTLVLFFIALSFYACKKDFKCQLCKEKYYNVYYSNNHGTWSETSRTQYKDSSYTACSEKEVERAEGTVILSTPVSNSSYRHEMVKECNCN